MKIVREEWSNLLEAGVLDVNAEFLETVNKLLYENCIDSKDKVVINEQDIIDLVNCNVTDKLEEEYLFYNDYLNKSIEYSLYSLCKDIIDELFSDVDSTFIKQNYDCHFDKIEDKIID